MDEVRSTEPLSGDRNTRFVVGGSMLEGLGGLAATHLNAAVRHGASAGTPNRELL